MSVLEISHAPVVYRNGYAIEASGFKKKTYVHISKLVAPSSTARIIGKVIFHAEAYLMA